MMKIVSLSFLSCFIVMGAVAGPSNQTVHVSMQDEPESVGSQKPPVQDSLQSENKEQNAQSLEDADVHAGQKTLTQSQAPDPEQPIAPLELDEAEDSWFTDPERNPHWERHQDPAIVEEARIRKEQGEEICSRCLMDCGAGGM